MKKTTDKKELIRGLIFLFSAMPFVFSGPVLLFAYGIPLHRKEGIILGILLSCLLMLIAIVLGILGIRIILNAFFSRK